MALAALFQLGISVAIQPAGARENGLDQQTLGTYADSQAGEQITTARSVLLVEPMLTPSTSARHFLLAGLCRF